MNAGAYGRESADINDVQRQIVQEQKRVRLLRAEIELAFLLSLTEHDRAGDADEVPTGLPARVFAFACQNVSPDVLRVIASAARAFGRHLPPSPVTAMGLQFPNRIGLAAGLAAVARRHQATLLTCDADLNRVARVIGIELDQPQPQPPQPT